MRPQVSLLLLIFTLVTACSATWAGDAATVIPFSPAVSVTTTPTPDVAAATVAATKPSRAELALFAMGLIGAVYRPGGVDPRSGMDCSGFVRYVYQEVVGLTLPHNAAAISKTSTVISKNELKPGDLVFFKTVKKAFSHVGIYLGNNQFVHASSSRTGVVMVSNLEGSYWSNHFAGARRVLAATHSDSSTTLTDTIPHFDSLTSDPIAGFAH